MSETQANKVDRYIGHLYRAYDDIVDQLATRSVEAANDTRRTQKLRRAPKTVSDPTGGPLIAWESDLETKVDRLCSLVAKTVSLAEACGMPVNEPLDDWMRIMDDDNQSRPLVQSRAWRSQVREAGRLATAATTCLHDGWRQLWTDRWITHPQGGQTLDEVHELWCVELAGEVDLLARTAKRLAGSLEQKAARQPDLVYCLHHPDKLAKYRKLGLCGACYEQERRAS